jgi:hypothetical protein
MQKNIKINVNDEEKILTFYDNIETLPIKRYQLVQKYSLIDAGIGSTLNDVMTKFAKFDQFLEVGDLESLAIERENMLININYMLNEKNTTGYLLASMIKTLDGNVIEINDDNIDELVDMLECSDISFEAVREISDAQKKSLIASYL